MTKRPNWSNKVDACCCCAKILPTPIDHLLPKNGDLGVWQPNPADPPQWICKTCKVQLELDARRDS